MKQILFIIYAFLNTTLFAHNENTELHLTITNRGQLGNNLFQVATASALAWDNNAQAHFPDYTHSSKAWNKNAKPHSKAFIRKKKEILDHILFRISTNTPPGKISRIWTEPSLAFHEIPFSANMHLKGYFQNDKYFVHHRAKILQLFAPHPDDLEYIQTKYQWLIDHPYTVGLQIRHYSDAPKAIQYGKAYFEKAMSLFSEDTLFILSSNDLKFSLKNLPTWAKNIYILDKEPFYIEFYLLSFCKHNIISNSSFGWWAAWLNENPDKIIVCPDRWGRNNQTKDICPENWYRVEAKPIR